MNWRLKENIDVIQVWGKGPEKGDMKWECSENEKGKEKVKINRDPLFQIVEFMSRDLQTLENPIVPDWHEHKAGAHLWRWWERKQNGGPELCQQSHGVRVYIQPNGLRREGSNKDVGGGVLLQIK